MNTRARRLADFQQGRAPELAVLAGSQAPGARVSMLERRRQALAGRDSTIGGEAAQAHASALVGEAVAALGAALADALGPARCPVCRCCKRAIGRDRRTCPHCGAKDAASAPWPLKAEDLNMPQADAA